MAYSEMQTLERRIDETRKMLDEIKCIDNLDIRDSMSAQLGIKLDDLLHAKEKLLLSQDRETISIRIYGDDVQRGKVSSRTLLSVLGGFQQLIESIGNAVIHAPTSRGRILSRVKSITDFQVVGTFAGSFGVRLEKEELQTELVAGSSELNSVLLNFFSVLETGGNDELLWSVIAPFGKRAVSSYRAWLSDIRENRSNVQVKWTDTSAEDRQYNMLYEKAAGIISALDTIGIIEDEEISIVGRLTGINVRSVSFEMSDTQYGIIKGKGKFETLVALANLLGKEISATIIKSISYTKSNIEKVSWFITDAKEDPPDGAQEDDVE